MSRPRGWLKPTRGTSRSSPERSSASTASTLKRGERVAVELEEAAGVKTAVKVRVVDQQTAMRYTCSMHPEVVSDKPGRCPKCGMNLTPVEALKR